MAIAKQPDADVDTVSEGEIECVVVEKDMPMYEATWDAIEQWVDSLPLEIIHPLATANTKDYKGV